MKDNLSQTSKVRGRKRALSPTEERLIYELYFVQDLSAAQIQQRFPGLSISAIRMVANRVRDEISGSQGKESA